MDRTTENCADYKRIFTPTTTYNLCDVPIEAKIINYEETHLLLSPYVYHIELNHGNFCWIIKRRHNQFRHLYNQIWIFYTKLSFPFPTNNSRENRKVLGKIGEIEFPKFPLLPETFVLAEGISRRIQLLQGYLNFLLNLPIFKQHPAVLTFLEISPYSFIKELGFKGEEFEVKKRAGGFRIATCCTKVQNFFTDITGHWRKRWLVVKNSCLFYTRPTDHKIRYVMLFDRHFFADYGMKLTGVQNGVRIRNSSRTLILKCNTSRRAKELAEYLNEASTVHARDFVRTNANESFAPTRKRVHSQWFVDGAAYFEAVLQAIRSARQEIYITDWWLSPEIYLKRPGIGMNYRLDRVLLQKAKQGVRIFVLLYKEMEIGLSINSIHSKHVLMQLHENISVLRHPDITRGAPLLWSHHEKLVVIDQFVAFVGGIDLCFGRWDTVHHQLTDLGGISMNYPEKSKETPLPVSNGGILKRSRSQPSLYEEEPLGAKLTRKKHSLTDDRSILEFAAKMSTTGSGSIKAFKESSNDNEAIAEESEESEEEEAERLIATDHNVEPEVKRIPRLRKIIHVKRIAAVSKFRRINRRFRNRISRQRRESIISFENFEDTMDHMMQRIPHLKRECSIDTDSLEGGSKLWMGKDYVNFIKKDFSDLHKPYQDSIDRNTTPRMPWHDVSCVVLGSVARDVARHFIQRWNYTKFTKVKFNQRYPWLIPKSYDNVDTRVHIPGYLTRIHRVTCQTLRSGSAWSVGISRKESSILEGYIRAIDASEHYIYIENQFFISSCRTHNDDMNIVQNKIAEAIYRRIMRAYHNKRKFRVYILIPLLPAFEGEIGTSSGKPIEQITHYNYCSICKGPNSLLGRLETEIEDPSEYIGFYSLRNHDELNGKLVTELVYVHSKIMIVDDTLTIIGSANINDRSMLGERDSEVAVIIEDETFDTYWMNGVPYKSGRFSGSLRRMLMREHLGVIPKPQKPRTSSFARKFASINVAIDPVSDRFWQTEWNETASRNSEIYEEVFGPIPSNEIKVLADLEAYQTKPRLADYDRPAAMERLANVRGHLVNFPLEFLINESSPVSSSAQDRILPQIVWT